MSDAPKTRPASARVSRRALELCCAVLALTVVLTTAFVGPGCGTMNGKMDASGHKKAYSGVQWDFKMMGEAPIGIPCFIIDLPFSFLADTVALFPNPDHAPRSTNAPAGKP